MLKMLLWLGIIAATGLVLSSLRSCGRLLDQDGSPVSGAWVVAERRECGGLFHCSTSCVELKVARTDDNGTYSFRSGIHPSSDYQITAYREGYKASFRPDWSIFLRRNGKAPMFASLDPVDARIAYLAHTARWLCFPGSDNERKVLLPLFKAMFLEAESLARYPEHHQKAREICAEMLWLRAPSSAITITNSVMRQYLPDVPACSTPIDDRKEKAILSAIKRGDPEPLRQAALAGFDFNRLLDESNPPIFTAAYAGRAPMIKELVALGAKVDAVGLKNRTTLEQAVLEFHGTAPVLTALLESGADPNRPDPEGYPLLLRLLQPRDEEQFELLLEHGARANQAVTCDDCQERGRTALHFNVDATQATRLIQHGADVNARASFGTTPLMYAQRLEVVNVLLANGADPNLMDGNGATALMYALRNSNREIAETLVAGGARLDIRNREGLDAFDYTQNDALEERLRELAQKYQRVH